MNEIRAYLHDGQSSARRAVIVKLTVPGYLVLQELGTVSRYRLDDLDIAPRLGSQPARITLPDGKQLEVADGPAFYDQLEHSGGGRQWVHALEARWSFVLLAVAVTVLLGWLAYDRGIPALARSVAFALPDEVNEKIGAQGLELLDQSGLLPSQLDIPRQYELRVVMMDVVETVGQPASPPYRLEFRQGGRFGANALALPDGTIVLTDELVQLAHSDDEIAAVLAHEVGHVRNRHALRALLQNSVIISLVVGLTGDVSAATSLGAMIPTVLAQAGYSRAFEYEADEVAVAYLTQRNISTRRFADLLLRLEEQTGGNQALYGLLATHPATDERIAALR